VLYLPHFIPTGLEQQPLCTMAALAGAEEWHAAENLSKYETQTSTPNLILAQIQTLKLQMRLITHTQCANLM
jgi:hypothetical protein